MRDHLHALSRDEDQASAARAGSDRVAVSVAIISEGGARYGAVRGAGGEGGVDGVRRRTRLAQAGAVVLLGVCLLAVAGGLGRGGRAELDELIPNETQGREGDALVDVDKTPAADPYCSVFGDPAECEKQKGDGMHMYWSPLQVRGELWKTMKALAELEMRENGHHSKHKAAAEEQAKVFQLFRETMAREVTDVHDLQEEMHQTHQAAFKKLSDDLVLTATSLKNYTDVQLGMVNGDVTALSKKQEADSQAALVQIAERVSEINARIAFLHNETVTHLNATERATRGVQEAMRASDAATDLAIKGIDAEVSALDAREAAHFQNASSNLAAQVAAQEEERVALSAKIDADVGALRTNVTAQLEVEEAAIRAMLASDMDGVGAATQAVRFKAEQEIARIRASITAMITDQDADNAAQERGLSLLRVDLDAQQASSLASLDAADARVASAFAALGAAQTALRQQAAADKAFLTSRVDGNVTTLDAQSAQLREWARSSADTINASAFAVQTEVASEATGMRATRDDDVLRAGAAVEDGLVALNASLLGRMASEKSGAAARLATKFSDITAQLGSMESESEEAHAALAAKFVLLTRMQAEDNKAQEGEVRAAEAGEAGEAAEALSQQAAVRGDLGRAEATRDTLEQELGTVQGSDKAAWTSQIATGFAGLQDAISKNVTSETGDIKGRISHALSAIRSSIEQLSAASLEQADNGEQALAGLSGAVDEQEEKDAVVRGALASHQTADRTEVEQRMARVIARVEAHRAQLEAAYARVAAERSSDSAAILAKEGTDTRAAQQALSARVAAAETALQAQLASAMLLLRQGVVAAEGTARADFAELDANVTDWDSERAAANLRLARRLARLQQSGTDSAAQLDASIAALAADLQETDTRLQAATSSVETLQDHTALSLNATLHASLATLSSSAQGARTSETAAVRDQLGVSLLALRNRMLSLERATNSTAKAVSAAVFAVEARLYKRDAATAAEGAALNQTAYLEQKQVEMEMARLSEKIKAGAVGLAAAMSSDEQGRARLAGELADGIDSDVDLAAKGYLIHLAANRTAFHLQIEHEVHIWMHTLTASTRTSLSGMADATARLSRMKGTEAADHALVESAVSQLEGSVRLSKASAQEALASLKQGLSKAGASLDALSGAVSSEVDGDSAEIEASVAAGVAMLRQNFSDALAAQKGAMTAHIADGARTLEDKITKMKTAMAVGAAAFNASVSGMAVEETAVGARQVRQVAALVAQRQRAAAGLQTSVAALHVALAAAGGELRATSSRLEGAGTAQWDALNAKLTSAAGALHAGAVELGAAGGGAVTVAKDAVAAARTSVTQEREAIKAAHAQDSSAIRTGLATGLAGIKANVTDDIETAVAAIQNAFSAQVAVLSSNVTGVKSRAAAAEQRLKAQVAGLKATEVTDDTAQEAKIKALSAKVAEAVSLTTNRNKDLNLKVNDAAAELQTDIKTLAKSRREDHAAVLVQIDGAVRHAQTALNSLVETETTQLRARIARATDEQEAALGKRRSDDDSEIASLTTKIAALTKSAQEAAVSNRQALQDLNRGVAEQGGESARNFSATWAAVHEVSNGVESEANRQSGALNQQLQAFKTEVDRDRNDLWSKFTTALTTANQALKETSNGIVGSVNTKVEGKYDSGRADNAALRARLEGLRRDQSALFSQSRAALQGVKGQTSGWAQSMLNSLRSLNRQLVVTKSRQGDISEQRVRSVDAVRAKLTALTESQAALQTLQASIASARQEAETDTAGEKTTFDATEAAVTTAKDKLSDWRGTLSDSLEEASRAVEKEKFARFANTRASNLKLGEAQRRMNALDVKLRRYLRRAVPRPVTQEGTEARLGVRGTRGGGEAAGPLR